MKKILHMQLSTTRQLQLTVNVRTEELATLLRGMPHDGATVVPVSTYIEVAVTNILSRLVLKKRFMAVAPGQEVLCTEQELKQVRNFKEITDDIAKYAQIINPGDFIPFFKWIDFQGFQRPFRDLRARMDAFMSKIISEHVEQRKSGSLSMKDMGVEKDMADVLLDQMEDDALRFDITDNHVNGTLWVRVYIPVTSYLGYT